MRRPVGSIASLALVSTLSACAGGTTQTSPGGASAAMTKAAMPRGSASVIVEAEIPASGAQNALEVIQRVRPSMLRARNGSTEETGVMDIVFYIDGVRAGDRQAVTSVLATNVKEIRFLAAPDATTRFGTGHALGAILVTTKR
jgi:hypothetical protein